jgi:RimJ/RimL family protein N-acetyltransferase
MFQLRSKVVYKLDRGEESSTQFNFPDVNIFRVNNQNVEAITDFLDEKYIKIFKDFLSQGHIGVYAAMDENIVGHAWSYITGRPSKRMYFPVNPTETLIFYCRVAPNYRGKSIYPAMLKRLQSILFQSTDINRIYIDTDVDNYASQRGIEKAGFVKLGNGYYVSIVGKHFRLFEQFERRRDA